jgi:uncharacterized membrane protein
VIDHAKTGCSRKTSDIVTTLPSIIAWRRTYLVLARRAAVAFLLLAGSATTALADFRLCNNTGSRVGVALGYKDGEGWITEGWWNVPARTCETLLRGALVARFYYIYAVDYDRGGEWSGHAFMCSREKEFTIRGNDNCLARGYDRTGYFEVDTGEQRSWTVQLTDTPEQSPDRPLLPLGPLRAPSAPPPPAATPPPASTPPPAEGGSK